MRSMRALSSLTLVLALALSPSLAISSGLGATAPSSPTPWLKSVVDKGSDLSMTSDSCRDGLWFMRLAYLGYGH